MPDSNPHALPLPDGSCPDESCPIGSGGDELIEEALTGALLSDPALLEKALLEEALLTEVRAAEAESLAQELSPAVRAAALRAFDAERAEEDERADTHLIASGRILRARRLQPLLSTRTWLSAAAMLLVTLAAGMFFSGSEPTAEAGIQLTALKRLDRAGASGMSQVESRYFAPVGQVFSPAADQWLSFAFAPEALLVVGAGDAVRVTRSKLAGTIFLRGSLRGSLRGPRHGTGRDAEAGRVDGGGATVLRLETTVLRLETGEARLATRAGAIAVEVAEAGLFVLLEGAAHIAVALEGASGMPVVALAAGSEARFHRPDGSSIPLAGPSRVLLGPKGPRTFGTAARSLFRELAFFGGPLPEPTQERRVSARLWRARLLPAGLPEQHAGPAGVDSPRVQGEQASDGWIRRRRADIQLLTQRAGTATAVALKWRPQRILSDAHLLRVALRAPEGTTVSLMNAGLDRATLRASVEASMDVSADANPVGANPVGASPVVGAETAAPTPEPGIATLEIPLPRGWYERLADGEMELVIRVPAAEQASGSPAAQAGPKTQDRRSPTRKAPTRRSGRREGVVRAWFDGVSLVLGPSENGLPRVTHTETHAERSPREAPEGGSSAGEGQK